MENYGKGAKPYRPPPELSSLTWTIQRTLTGPPVSVSGHSTAPIFIEKETNSVTSGSPKVTELITDKKFRRVGDDVTRVSSACPSHLEPQEGSCPVCSPHHLT